MSSSLQGLRVLVTRPEHQAGPLCQLIERHGGVAVRCPTLLIREPQDWGPALALFDRLATYDLAIFTSVNAVDRALPPIRERGGIPPGLEIAAIGKATARALARHGIDHGLQPEHDFSSEALMALPRFQNVTGQRIVIIRGEGGRTLLAETLTARGARVDHAEVYRRERPTAANVGTLLERWARGEIGAIVVSARTRQIAAEYGCRHLLLAREASDDAIAAALPGLMANPSPVQLGNAT